MTKFVNPYNFIPFGKGPIKQTKSQVYGDDSGKLKQGWLRVRLTVKEPLIIPVLKAEPDGHKTYDFFGCRSDDSNNPGDPAIPGSSLRGMIRNIYEIASDSCVPFVKDDNDVTLRTPTYAAFKDRGLLGYDKEKGWMLYEAEEVYKVDDPICKSDLHSKIRQGRYKGIANGDRVEFNIMDAKKKLIKLVENGEHGHEGWIQFNSPPALKDTAYYFVRVLVPKKEPIPLFAYVPENPEKQAVDRYNLYSDLFKTLESTVNKDKNPIPSPWMSLKENLESVKKNKKGLVPVWYRKVTRSKAKDKYNTEDAVYYLSPSAIGRVSMHRKWEEILGQYAPCSKEENKKEEELKLCPACWLFGNVREDRRNKGADFQQKGRLRFTDAVPYANVKICPKDQTLQILSQPRPSAYEFYLNRPNENTTYWNYDYYITTKRVNGKTESEYHYIKAPTLKGRKLYWHSGVQRTTTQKSELNGTFRTAEKGSQFEFKIYFDGITRTQLNQLKWVVTLGDNQPDSIYQHKLGHGRPLGYGSVKLTIVSTHEREITKTEGGALSYSVKETVESGQGLDWPVKEDDTAPKRIEALRTMAKNDDAIRSLTVDYPRVAGDEKIFKWFIQNRKKASTLKVLPNPLDEDITLSDDWSGDVSGGNQATQSGRNGNSDSHTGGQGQLGGVSYQNGQQYQRKKPSPGSGKLTGKTVKGKVRNKDRSENYFIVFPGETINGFLGRWKVRGIVLEPGDSVTVKVGNISDHGTYDVDLIR